jgi:AbrB family looped-hinge helix DNA binding protein
MARNTATATLTSKGQITLPGRIRSALGLRSGDKIDFVLGDDGSVELHPANVDLMSLRGAVSPDVRGVTLENMEEAIAAEGAGK